MSRQDPPKAVRIDSWGFDGNWPASRPGIPMIGIFLIIFGLLLGAGQLFNQAAIAGSALFLALGIVLLIVGLRDRSDFALYAGVFIIALALSDLLHNTSVIAGPGWGPLFLGIGVLAVAGVRALSSHRLGIGLAVGALLALWGGSDVASYYSNFSTDRLVGPVLLVILGFYVVTRGWSGRRR
jgi:hypothetical protein